MMRKKITTLALYLLIGGGLYGAVKVSYNTITGAAPCPDLFGIPACYMVTVGYLGMLSGLLFSQVSASGKLFLSGWAVVFGFAALGTFLEVTVGNVCPRTGSGFPLCYLSLGLSIVLFILFQRSRETGWRIG